jgi:hypothetical protein
MEVISIRDIARWIDSGQPFVGKVVTYDRKRKTGGQILDIEGVLARVEHRTIETEYEKRDRTKRAQNHHDQFTRNIALTVDGHRTAMIRKVHVVLFLQFNNKTVVP